MYKKVIVSVFVMFVFNAGLVFAQEVVSVDPGQNALNIPKSANISAIFDQAMDSTTINDSTFIVYSLRTGLHTGTYSYDSGTNTATFDPDENLGVGEIVSVILTTNVEDSTGNPLSSPYEWSFTIEVDGGSGTFASNVDYGAGSAPWAISSADLDADGDMDLAVANHWADSVSILLNNGDGTFATKVGYDAGDGPSSAFSSDLDGDGDMDLAIANYSSDNISVLLNNGNGTFATKVDYGAGDGPYSIFSSDLDTDGYMDLAVANGQSDNVSVLLNDGDGSFAAKVDYNAGDLPTSVFASDLDEDGDMDSALANEISDNVSILLNNGNGTFSPKVDYSTGSTSISVFSSDLDADGDMDLAVANNSSGNVSVLLNNGNGTFATKEDYNVGDAPYSILSSDLDGDGDMDLAVANQSSNDVSILFNNDTRITVTSPNGGEEWKVDSTCNVTWESFGTSGAVKIEYSTDNGFSWSDVIASTTDDGSYPWIIPDTPSDSCLVMISDTNGFLSDTSNAVFSILPGSGIFDDVPDKYSFDLQGIALNNLLKIKYTLPEKVSVVRFAIYDIAGKKIKEKRLNERSAGFYSLDINMNGASKGVYFIRIEANEFKRTNKAVLM